MSSEQEIAEGHERWHLDLAARWVIRSAFESWVADGWEMALPDVGEFDYERIVERAEQLLPAEVTVEEWVATYDYFAARADKEVT